MSFTMLRFFAPLAIFLLATQAGAAPEIPARSQEQPIALIGGTIHPVSSEPIAEGVIVFAQGEITAIGKDVAIPEDARQVDVSGKHVYPGLFDAMTNLGLVEINAIRATRDQAEAGDVNPNVKAQVAVNPDSEHIPVTRSNGVLLALTAPSGSLISGKSAVIQLDGWTYEDMTVQADVGMHVDWPRMKPAENWASSKSGKQEARRDEALRTLNDTFDKARAYQQARQADPNHPVDLRWEAMLPVLEGKLPLIVAADDLQEIQAAASFAQRQGVKMILYGGYDAPLCAPLLKKNNIPVIIGGTLRLPERRGDDYDAAYTLPERLRKLGVAYCISGAGRFGASQVRNLPYHAAMAAAFGLPRQEALRAITLYPAEILGVADRVGSLEVGKDATLIITDGDPLETFTQVEAAYVQGSEIDLMDRHKRLWKKYQEKYRRLAAPAGP